MGLLETLRTLERLARDAGIELRWDRGVGRGGFCKVGGRRMILCDPGLSLSERVAIVSAAMVEQGVEVPAELSPRAPTVRVKPTPKPPRATGVKVVTSGGPKKAVPRPALVTEAAMAQGDERPKAGR